MSGSSPAGSSARARVPIREGLFAGSLDDLASLRLAGSRCSTCRETSFGRKSLCPNCGQATVESMALSARGVLWSFTVVRHRPPGDYRGPDPFAPFALGLVELPDGVRVLSRIECPTDELGIGLELRLRPYLRHDQEQDTVVFAFEPIGPGDGHG